MSDEFADLAAPATTPADEFADLAKPVGTGEFADLAKPSPQEGFLQQLKTAIRTSLEEQALAEAGKLVGEAAVGQTPLTPGPDKRWLPAGVDIPGTLPTTVEEASKPFAPIPKLPVKPEEPAGVAAVKAAWNLAAGAAEFTESPLGVASAAASTIAAPVVAGAFLIDTLKGLADQTSDLVVNWENLTPAEKAEGLVNEVGLGAFGTLMGAGVVKGAGGVEAQVRQARVRARMAQLPTTQAALPPASGQMTAGATPIGTVVPAPANTAAPVRPYTNPIFAPDPTPPVEVIRAGEMGAAKLEPTPETEVPNAIPKRSTEASAVGEAPSRGAEMGEQVRNAEAPAQTRQEAEVTTGRMDALEKWADRKIQDALRQSNTLSPDLLAAGVTKGAILFSRGIVNFAHWASEMVGLFGEAIKPHLQELFTRSQQAAQANKTARAAGAVGARAITPAYVATSTKPGESVLNFGAGKPDSTGHYLHSDMIRANGGIVSEYDFGKNAVGALGKTYDTVFASNVLNVQADQAMLRDTLTQIRDSTVAGGRAVFNFPKSPRYSALSVDTVAKTIADVFGAEPVQVGGTKRAPLWEVRRSTVVTTPERPATIALRNRKTGEVWDTGARIHAEVPWEKAPAWVKEWLIDPEKPSWMFKSGSTDVLENTRMTTRGRVVGLEEADKLEGEAITKPTPPTQSVQPPAQTPAQPVAPPGTQPLVPPPTPGALPSPMRGGPLGIVPPGTAWVQSLLLQLNDSRFFSRYFTKERGLDPADYASWRKRMGRVSEEAGKAMFASQDLTRALREHAGVKTDMGLRKWVKQNPGLINDINLALADQNLVANLPAPLQAPVQAMRMHIDSLSSYMLNNNLVSGKIRATIGKNLGSYLTRSYRVFEDPKYEWKDIPQTVKNNANYWLQLYRGMSDVEATRYLQNMFSDFKEQGVGQLFQARKLGGKDVSVLMHRKDIAPEIRALMGEYNDPFVNYLRTASKLTRLVADQEFLIELKQHGRGRWLFPSSQAPEGFNTLIAGHSSNTYSPLNGMRTSPTMAAILKEWNRVPDQHHWAVNAYLWANNWSKAMKTVYSAMTHARNILGQPFFWLMNGHYNPLAIREAVEMIKTERGLNTDAAWRDYYQKLSKWGLVGESAYSGELRAMLQDFSTKLTDPNVSPLSYSMGRLLKDGLVSAPEWLYRVTDEFGKVVGFENEVRRQMRDNPALSWEEAGGIAAERIRNTYPTYSNISEAVKGFRHVPLTGPFMGFAYESFRTVAHSLHYAVQDLRAGRVRSGTERAAGALVALGVGSYGLQALSKYMLGINDQTEQDLRRELPDFEKNSALLFTGKEDGKVSRVNLSYANPYNYLTDPIIAVSSQKHEDVQEAMVNAVVQFLKPYTSEQMLAGALISWRRNKDERGMPIYNPEDTPGRQAEDVIKYLFKQVGPGTVVRATGRILPAAKGEPQAQSLTTEVLAELTGFREVTTDFKEQVRFAGYQAKQRLGNAHAIFTEGISSKKPSTDIAGQYSRSEDARYEILRELFAHVQGARRQGVSDADISKQLKLAGIAGKDLGVVMSGIYNPAIPSKETFVKAGEAGKAEVMAEAMKQILPESQRRAGKPLE